MIVVPLCRFLADAGADIEHRTWSESKGGWRSALHIASVKGYAEFVEFLLEAKADVDNTTKPARFTPLCCAAITGHANVVRVRAS